MAKLKKRRPSQVPETDQKPLVGITEADQWRIIKETGILDRAQTSTAAAEEQLLSPLTEEIFAALALIIPHSFLLLMMEL